mgnify:CR=1 FL=1
MATDHAASEDSVRPPISGTNGRTTLQESAIRTALGLYSTDFHIVQSGSWPDLVTVTGAGGSKERRISDSYVLSAGGVTRASSAGEQYIVLTGSCRHHDHSPFRQIQSYPLKKEPSADSSSALLLRAQYIVLPQKIFTKLIRKKSLGLFP